MIDSTISFLCLSGPDPVNTHVCNFTQVISSKTVEMARILSEVRLCKSFPVLHEIFHKQQIVSCYNCETNKIGRITQEAMQDFETTYIFSKGDHCQEDCLSQILYLFFHEK